jgi:hypothetical protein
MKDPSLLITPTDQMDTLNGTPVRFWKGVDDIGQNIIVLVAAVLVPDSHDQTPYAGLKTMQATSPIEVA